MKLAKKSMPMGFWVVVMSSDDSRRYRNVETAIWGDERFRRLSAPQPCGQSLFQYLLYARESIIIPGIIPAGKAALAEALRWPLEGFEEAFAEVFAEGMAEADWDARLVWLPNALKIGSKRNKPASPNVVRAWAKEFTELPECDLKRRIHGHLKAYTKALGKAFAEAFNETFPEIFRARVGDQDQYQKAVPESRKQKGLDLASLDPPASVAADGTPPRPSGIRRGTGPTPKAKQSAPPSPPVEAKAKSPSKGESCSAESERLVLLHYELSGLSGNTASRAHKDRIEDTAKAVKKHGAESVEAAIRGGVADDWCKQTGKYRELEWILRDTPKFRNLTKYAEQHRNPPKLKAPPLPSALHVPIYEDGDYLG